MNKKTKKQIDVLRQKITKYRVLLSAAKAQCDDPGEVTRLEQEIAASEAKIEELKEAG